jgi:hypothetical protein
MNSDHQAARGQELPTEVRFSVRSLLILMAVVAPATALLGFALRHVDEASQSRFALCSGCAVLIFIAGAVHFAWRRRRAELLAGHVFFELVAHSYFLPRWPRVASMLAGVALLLCFLPALMAVYFVATGAVPAFNWANITMYVVLYWYLYGMWRPITGLTYIWWGGRFRFCEHGIVIRHKFVPWERLASFYRFYWDAVDRNVCVLERQANRTGMRQPPPKPSVAIREGWRYGSGFRRIAAIVPPGERDAVVALLKDRLTIQVGTEEQT